jgi:sulfite reductase beta subunit-like hemoprotein/nitrite reductase/ring-hydroxylating ferredoxin subunit
MPPNIPAAKRAGLKIDFTRLAEEGDSCLSPEDRYALKTYGVCGQEQDHVFMIRNRVPGGVLLTEQARGLARVGRIYSNDWLHLTTRQNVEFHWVADRKVPEVLDKVTQIGLTNRSACGHTMRNVMCSEEAGVSLDEPFDCLPDARAVSDTIVARAATINCVMPSRVNLAFGGSPRCREDALVNDGGFISVVRDGEAGYELWSGGSLGKAPRLALKLADFIPRRHAVAAAEAIFDVFIAHGDFENPTKGRLKFAVEKLGEDGFRAAWEQAFEAAKARPRPDPAPVEVLEEADRVAVLSEVPAGGWRPGVRPQRIPGLAVLGIDIPLGDCCGADFELLSDIADRHGDGVLHLDRDQNVRLRNIPVDRVADIRDTLRGRGLFLLGESHVAAVRACTGSAVCALGMTRAPDAGASLMESPALGRNSALRVHISGCPNSCAQHQIGDIGLAGSKVRIAGKTRDGYVVYLGADLANRRVGQVVGRVAVEHVRGAVDAIVNTWESLRHGSESLTQTVERVGQEAFAAYIAAVVGEAWASGPEPTVPLIDEQPTVPVRAATRAAIATDGGVRGVPGDDVLPGAVEAVKTNGINGTNGASAQGDVPAEIVLPTGPEDGFLEACRLEDLPPGKVRTVEVDGEPVCLVNIEGTVCAVGDMCPHAWVSLGGGTLEGFALKCPGHAAHFDVRTGEVLDGPPDLDPDESLETYAVRVEDGVVKVSLTAQPAAASPG